MLCPVVLKPFYTRQFFFTQAEFCINLATSWLHFYFTSVIANNSGSNLTLTKSFLLNLLCISIVSRRFRILSESISIILISILITFRRDFVRIVIDRALRNSRFLIIV